MALLEHVEEVRHRKGRPCRLQPEAGLVLRADPVPGHQEDLREIAPGLGLLGGRGHPLPRDLAIVTVSTFLDCRLVLARQSWRRSLHVSGRFCLASW